MLYILYIENYNLCERHVGKQTNKNCIQFEMKTFSRFIHPTFNSIEIYILKLKLNLFNVHFVVVVVHFYSLLTNK